MIAFHAFGFIFETGEFDLKKSSHKKKKYQDQSREFPLFDWPKNILMIHMITFMNAHFLW